MHEDHEDIVSADGAKSLSECLATIEVSSVVERTKCKKIELIQVCRFLSAFAETNYLFYPLSLTNRESPDFLLNCNGEEIGIEATEATHKDYKQYLAHAECRPSDSEESSDILAVPVIRYGDKLTLMEKNNHHERNELDDGWSGNTPEKDWLLYIKDAIANKCEKLTGDRFERFEQNWLLIYANPPACFLKKEKLDSYIQNLWPTNSTSCFDRIFIESSWSEDNSSEHKSWIIALSSDKTEFFSVENIWDKAS